MIQIQYRGGSMNIEYRAKAKIEDEYVVGWNIEYYSETGEKTYSISVSHVLSNDNQKKETMIFLS